jgi:flagellar hook protein FlgE
MFVSASGMEAASTQFDVAAGNIANMDTPGYQARSAMLAAVPGGGVTVTGVGVPAGAPGAIPGTSNVDLGEQTVSLMIASAAYTANGRALSAESRMIGSLFDERV